MTVVTSVILYIVPQRRIAYWTDWRLWELSKEPWGNIHIKTLLRDLSRVEIKAIDSETIKKIAEKNQTGPHGY